MHSAKKALVSHILGKAEGGGLGIDTHILTKLVDVGSVEGQTALMLGMMNVSCALPVSLFAPFSLLNFSLSLSLCRSLP